MIVTNRRGFVEYKSLKYSNKMVFWRGQAECGGQMFHRGSLTENVGYGEVMEEKVDRELQS